MSRKKATKKKVKGIDSYGNRSQNSSSVDLVHSSSEENLLFPGNLHSEQDVTDDRTRELVNLNQQTPLMPSGWNEQSKPGSTLNTNVKIKIEPNLETEQQACICTNMSSPTSNQASASDSEQSTRHLNSGTDLTWSQLLEAKNLPKVHIPEKLPRNVVVKAEKPNSESLIVLSSSDNSTEGREKRSKNIPGEEKAFAAGSGVSSSSTIGSSHRFSKNQESGSNLLDLSKKSIPVEIRRILSTKYGAIKEGQSGGVVPNLNKSRSRFTLSSKKSGLTDSDDDAGNRAHASGPSSTIHMGQDLEVQRSHGQPSSVSSKKLESSSRLSNCKSVPPMVFSGSHPVPAKVAERRRFSSSTYESRRSSQSAYQCEAATSKLQSGGLVDLGSHYGNLLKDSPPPLACRNSESPHEEPTNSVALGKGQDGSAIKDRSVANEETKRIGKSSTSIGTRRSSYSGELPAGYISLNFSGETFRQEGAMELNEARPPNVSGRSSKSPADPCLSGETMIEFSNDATYFPSNSSSR